MAVSAVTEEKKRFVVTEVMAGKVAIPVVMVKECEAVMAVAVIMVATVAPAVIRQHYGNQGATVAMAEMPTAELWARPVQAVRTGNGLKAQ